VNPALKLGGFVGGLAAAFALAFTVGSSTDPIRAEEPAAPAMDDMGDGHAEEAGSEHGGGHDAGTGQLPGLAVSDAGYTLVPAAPSLPSGPAVPFRFRVTGPDGRALHDYELSHEKELHLIVVRRDLDGFQHVHPVRAADGTWSVPLDLRKGGTYRMFADFKPAGLDRGLTLGTDVSVAGPFTPVPLPEPATRSVVDGYDVTLAGTPVAGEESELTFTVSRNGKPVRDLEPYLGAFGHLVSLRTGDLAYLHTHPAQEAHAGERGGPQVTFATTFPTAGTYRLFLDYQHGGEVRTASFTVNVGASTAEPVTPTVKPTVKPTAKPKPTPGKTPHGTPGHGHS
jgi:hypothetical protein